MPPNFGDTLSAEQVDALVAKVQALPEVSSVEFISRDQALANFRDQLAAQGVTNVATFTTFYWNQQLQTAGLLVGLTVVGGLGGGLLYGLFRPKPEPVAAPTP